VLHDIEKFQQAIGALERCPSPVIISVHRLVLVFGIDIVSACDIRTLLRK
jgi:enoyl-CoA hydratase/carnithine racemase